MSPKTIPGFVFAGLALLAFQKRKRAAGQLPSGAPPLTGLLAGGLVAFIGLLTVSEFLVGEGPWMGRLLLQGHPGSLPWLIERVDLPSALNFLFIGCGLLLLDVGDRAGRRPTEYLGFATVLGGLFGVLDFTFHPSLVSTGIPLNTALLDCALGCGLLCARPERGFVKLLSSRGLAGSASRRLLPAAVLIPSIFGSMMWWGIGFGTRNRDIWVMLLVVASAATLLAISAWTTEALDRTDRERRTASEALRRAGAYNRTLIEASLDPLVTIAPDGKVTDVNNATERVTGHSRQELVGTDFSGYFTEPERARAGYQQVFREGWVQDYELGIRHRDGRVTPVLYNASLYRDEAGQVVGVFAAARDISERKKAERELRRLNRALRTISECNQVIVRAQEERELLYGVCGILLKEGGYRMAWVGYAEQDEAKAVRPVASAGFEEGYLEHAQITWADAERGRGPTGRAVRSGEPSIARNTQQDPISRPGGKKPGFVDLPPPLRCL